MLPELRKDLTTAVDIQESSFSTDVLGRFTCSSFDEVVNNGGMPFDVVVIGAGMFGAYTAEKLYRQSEDLNLRILVLDAGSFLLPTHVQNIPHLGLFPPGIANVTRNDQDPGRRAGVWGLPWHSNEPFTGLAYCTGGRSIYWGGWAPRYTQEDLALWPAEARDFMNANYDDVEDEIGVKNKADYITGVLNDALISALNSIKNGSPATTDSVTIESVDEAPLAVEAAAPGSGLFSFDKYCSVPMLLESIRNDVQRHWTPNDDSRRRLFLMPRSHVVRLQTQGGKVTGMDMAVDGQRHFLTTGGLLSQKCCFVIGSGTIEATRLALESFPVLRGANSMGANFMAHLRTNLTVRVKRSALGLGAVSTLEQGGAIVRGQIDNSNGSKRRYHLQVLASAEIGNNPESAMWAMVPDIDLFRNMLLNQSPEWVTIVLRGIGEVMGDKTSGPGSSNSFITLTNGFDPAQVDEFGARRAWVNYTPNADDYVAWNCMAQVAVNIAEAMGRNPGDVQYFYNNTWNDAKPNDPFGTTKDQLGNTHHEAGTLWMGSDPQTSITDSNGKFHHIENCYVVGPALFPTVGSANPSLNGLTLARKTVNQVIADLTPMQSANFRDLYDGNLSGWQMAGNGYFMQVYSFLETTGGPGILWYTREVFDDFVLELEWLCSQATDNSGVFIRIPTLNSSSANDWLPAVEKGYEVQIDPRGYNSKTNTENDPYRCTGAIYDLCPATTMTAAFGPWQWNKFRIEALGNRITVMLNDMIVCDYTDNKLRSLRGHIGLQNSYEGSKVQFRNIRIQNIMLEETMKIKAKAKEKGKQPVEMA